MWDRGSDSASRVRTGVGQDALAKKEWMTRMAERGAWMRAKAVLGLDGSEMSSLPCC